MPYFITRKCVLWFERLGAFFNFFNFSSRKSSQMTPPSEELQRSSNVTQQRFHRRPGRLRVQHNVARKEL